MLPVVKADNGVVIIVVDAKIIVSVKIVVVSLIRLLFFL